MTRKKNGFWTFVFSLLPGAGEMYMGFFKQGISLMGMFFLIIFMATWLNIGPLLFVIPIVWFYGFFHVHNLRSLPDEEFYALEDGYLFELENIMPKGGRLSRKWRGILAVVLIAVGAFALVERLLDLVYWILPDYLTSWFWKFWHTIPQMAFAAALIFFGLWLIRGKKRELDQEDGKDGGQP